MSNVAYLPIEADRYGACVRQIYIRGLDLTGIAMRAQVRLAGDTPGVPLVDLQTVTNGNAEGLRLVGVETVEGLPVSHVELVINETTLESLPYAGELGSATNLLWDWQMVLAGRKQRIARGEFVITGDGVTGADNAPTNRPQAWSRSFSPTAGMRTGATLTFGDEIATITIDSADLIAPLRVDALEARDDARAAAALAGGSATSASLSAATALTATNMYPTTAAGLAAVAEGAYFTVAGNGANTYAILYRKTGGAAVEAARYASKAAYEGSGGAGLIGTANGRTLQQTLNSLPAYAGDHGIRGDGTIETAAVQAFLDWCEANGRSAHFRSMAAIIDGPLIARNVPVIFDLSARDAGGTGRASGFYAVGSGYTAITFIGVCPGTNVIVRGGGGVTYDQNWNVVNDPRPEVNGVQFGNDQTQCFLSSIPLVFVAGLKGFGVKRVKVWDCFFGTTTVEDCGSDTEYAFHKSANATDDCNEGTDARLQVERSHHKAIYIDPRTLAWTFLKIHSEGNVGKPGVDTWVLGGACSYGESRLRSLNEAQGRSVGPVLMTRLRAEGIPFYIDASGATATFVNCGGSFYPADNQSGRINFIGGAGSFKGIGQGWELTSVVADEVEVGFCPPRTAPIIRGGSIGNLHARNGEAQAEVQLEGVRVTGSLAGFRDFRLLAGTIVTGNQSLANQKGTIDATSRIVGNVNLDTAALRIAGTIEGNLSVAPNQQRAIADPSAAVTGSIDGWAAPTGETVSGPYPNMTFSKNLVATAPGHPFGWYKLPGGWIPSGVVPS